MSAAPSPESPSRAECAAEFHSLHHRLMRRFARARSITTSDSQLTMQQLKVLAMLDLEGPRGGQELARALNVSMATITGIVDRLLAKGLVERNIDPTDRRIRQIRSTPAGTEVVDQFLVSEHEFFLMIVNNLTDEKLAVVLRAAHYLIEATGPAAEHSLTVTDAESS